MKTRKIKAQAAMEYLMTYGWAILIVVIVAAALYALGIFNPGTFTQAAATGFTGFSVPAGGWKVNSSYVVIQLQNVQGSNINVTSVVSTMGTSSSTGATSGGVVINSTQHLTFGPNAQKTIMMTGMSGPTTGSSYTIRVGITYDNVDTGLTGFTSSGTLTGTATA